MARKLKPLIQCKKCFKRFLQYNSRTSFCRDCKKKYGSYLYKRDIPYKDFIKTINLKYARLVNNGKFGMGITYTFNNYFGHAQLDKEKLLERLSITYSNLLKFKTQITEDLQILEKYILDNSKNDILFKSTEELINNVMKDETIIIKK